MPVELRSVLGLSLLGLLVPLVVLYILRIRRQRLRVPSTWLWQAAARDLRARHPFKKLIAELPLVVQALALIALAFALSRPATRGASVIGDHVAIIVDTSASMTAVGSDGRERIEIARRAAHDTVDALGPGAEAIVIDAGPSPQVVSPLDRDRRRLHAAVDRVSAREATGSLREAVALAGDRLKQLSGVKRLVVITDGALADPTALDQVALPLEVVRVGAPTDNTAIVRVDVRRGRDPSTKRPQVQAFALVASYAATPRDLFVTLRPRNVKEPLASRQLHLAPNERAPVVLTFEPAPGDAGMGLVFELSPGDALGADDRAYGRVPFGREVPVVIAPKRASPWFVRALQADPDAELMGVDVADLPAAEVPEGSLVVVEGACPQVLPGATFVLLNPPTGPCRNVVVGPPVEHPSITSWSEADARLRFLTLDGVELKTARRIELDSLRASLVRSQEGTVIADVSPPGRVGTLLGFDVGESNWPLKASFVLFVRNLLEVTREERARGLTGSSRTGHPLELRVPLDVETVSVLLPDDSEQKVPARAGLAVIPDANRAGFYHASWQGAQAGSVLVATNFTDPAESDLRPRELSPSHAGLAITDADDLEAVTDWGWVLALVALALIAFDVWWLTREPRRNPERMLSRPRLPERGAGVRP